MARKGAAVDARFRHELRPVSELHAGAAGLLRSVRRTRRPIVLTKDDVPQGVLLDVATYSVLRETALLLEVIAMGRREERSPRPGRKRRAVKRR